MEYTAGGKGNAVAPQTVVDEDHHERAERTASTRAREDLAASPSASPGLVLVTRRVAGDVVAVPLGVPLDVLFVIGQKSRPVVVGLHNNDRRARLRSW